MSALFPRDGFGEQGVRSDFSFLEDIGLTPDSFHYYTMMCISICSAFNWVQEFEMRRGQDDAGTWVRPEPSTQPQISLADQFGTLLRPCASSSTLLSYSLA